MGPSQFVVSSESLSDKELDFLNNYLLRDYTSIRENMPRDKNMRSTVSTIFAKGMTVGTKFVVYRSQTRPFDTNAGKQSIISTVKEPERCEGFGGISYAFILSPGVRYINVEWNLNDGKGPFTEIILPFDGHFRKVRKPAANLSQYNGVFRYNEQDQFSASVSNSASSPSRQRDRDRDQHQHMQHIQRMGFELLDEFRSLPTREQTKATLLDMLNKAYDASYSILTATNSNNSLPFEWATPEKDAMKSLLRKNKQK